MIFLKAGASVDEPDVSIRSTNNEAMLLSHDASLEGEQGAHGSETKHSDKRSSGY